MESPRPLIYNEVQANLGYIGSYLKIKEKEIVRRYSNVVI